MQYSLRRVKGNRPSRPGIYWKPWSMSVRMLLILFSINWASIAIICYRHSTGLSIAIPGFRAEKYTYRRIVTKRWRRRPVWRKTWVTSIFRWNTSYWDYWITGIRWLNCWKIAVWQRKRPKKRLRSFGKDRKSTLNRQKRVMMPWGGML